MKLKTIEIDGKMYSEVQDGKPVFLHDDGKEIPFDAPAAVASIASRADQASRVEVENKALKEAVSKFEGLDAQSAREAIKALKNIESKKLIDAGEVETVKAEISKAFQAQIDELTGKNQTLEQQLYGEKIGGSFARSKFIAEKLAVPADMIQATFGKNLKIEDGKVVAYDAHGNKIFSRARPGELADFDEAIETLVEQYPHKEHIIKSSGANGGGAGPSGGGGQGKPAGNFGGSRDERKAAIAARFDLPAA